MFVPHSGRLTLPVGLTLPESDVWPGTASRDREEEEEESGKITAGELH